MSRRNSFYFLSLVPGCLVLAGNMLGGDWVWMNFIFSLGLLPILEWFVPQDRSNSRSADAAVPDTVLVLHFLMQPAVLIFFVLSVMGQKMTGWHLIGAMLSTGVHSGSSSIVVAHELIHRKSAIWQAMGRILLWSAGNIYFFVEHLRVHHKWVGTDRDPATARKGESLYRFFSRSVSGQLLGAWHLEKQRLEKEGRSRFSLSNQVLLGALVLLATLSVSYFAGGWLLSAAFLFQWLIANFLLEYTNYIEHYGLARAATERVREHHSWQTDKLISRFLLIDLSRHADHHYYASKPFHTLDSYPDSPVIPGGYTSAIYLALLPPLWFRIIDPLVEKVGTEISLRSNSN